VVILTKGAQKNRWRNRVTPYDIESDFETSLAKLGVDYVDIYLLHRDDPSVPTGTGGGLRKQMTTPGITDWSRLAW
jgi:aryl-alcohol dehydrogenase-like predicted oxidoreductase